MSRRRSTLGELREELKAIEVFDRVHDFATKADALSDAAHANRQIRRTQIISEIEKLKHPAEVGRIFYWLRGRA